MSKLQEKYDLKYDLMCEQLEDDFRQLEDARYGLENACDDARFAGEDLKSAADNADAEELQSALDRIDGNSFVSDVEDCLHEIKVYEEHIPKLVKGLTGLEKRLEIRYKDSNFIDILKSYKGECVQLCINIPKKPKSKKK